MEDYKKKYEQALGRARTFSQRWQGIEATDSELALQELKEIFPELRESEDERTRNEIIAFVEQSIHRGGGTPIPEEKETKWLTWLEKQGENQYDEGTFVNVDDVRDDFMSEVYRVLDSDTTNDRANQIIQAFDSLPTVVIKKQSEESIITVALTKAGLKIYKDGDKWCILVGDNIQDGICGFGDTIDEALFEFLKELVEKQGEQKEIDYNEELKKCRDNPLYFFDKYVRIKLKRN